MRTAAWVAGIAVLAGAVWWLADIERDRAGFRRTEPGGRDHRVAQRAETGSAERAPTRLAGRVVEDGSGKPIAGARVRIHPAPPLPEHVMRLAFPAALADAVTEDDGTFSFENLPRDTRTIVRAVAEGWLPAHAPCPGDGADVELALQRGERTTVRVVDREGHALADAVGIVYAAGAAWPRAVIAAEPDGSLALRFAPRARLLVRAPGYATASLSRPPRGLIVLGPEYRIAGRVVTEADEPLAGVTIVLDCAFRPDEATHTDEEGRFAFGNLRYQSCWLTVEAEGLVRRYEATPGDEDMRIVLTGPQEVSGTVAFPDGTPAAGATVNGFPVDDRGRFVVKGLPPVLSRLDARHGELPAAPGEEVSPPALAAWIEVTPPAHGVRLVLEPQHRSFARLRLRDAAGKPTKIHYVPDARVEEEEGGTTLVILAEPPALARTFHVTTQSPFTLEVEATVRTWPTAEEAVTEELTQPDAPEATLVVRAPDGSVLPRDVEVSVEFPAWAWEEEQTAPDRLTFGFDPARYPDERFTPQVAAPGYPQHMVDLPRPRPGDFIEVRLARPASIVGRAVGPDGEPVRKGSVWVSVRKPPLVIPEGAPVDIPSTNTFGPDGSFRVAPVHGGEAVIRIDPGAGPPLAVLERTLIPGSVLDLGTVRLRPLRKVTGRVVDGRGRPLSGVQLRLHDEWETEVTGATVRDGTFHLEVPAYARGVIVATKPHHATVGVALDEAATIRLPTPGRVRLVLRAPQPVLDQGYDEDPGGNWYVYARRPGADWSWQPDCEEVERAPERWVRLFCDLPPGPLEFFVCTKGGEGSVEVTVAPGTTVAAELVIP